MDIIQPKDIFDLLKVKNADEAEQVLTTVINLLVYLKPGSKLVTSSTTFEKLSQDILHIDTELNIDNIVDSIEKKKIISFPV